jgi:hypothetical protein
MVEFAKETIEDMRKKYKEIKTVENKLLGVQVKNKPSSVKSYAIQFTGEDQTLP